MKVLLRLASGIAKKAALSGANATSCWHACQPILPEILRK